MLNIIILTKTLKKELRKMEKKEKKSKRIRHPKKKEEQPKHYVLEVQDGNGFTKDNFGK